MDLLKPFEPELALAFFLVNTLLVELGCLCVRQRRVGLTNIIEVRDFPLFAVYEIDCHGSDVARWIPHQVYHVTDRIFTALGFSFDHGIDGQKLNEACPGNDLDFTVRIMLFSRNGICSSLDHFVHNFRIPEGIRAHIVPVAVDNGYRVLLSSRITDLHFRIVGKGDRVGWNMRTLGLKSRENAFAQAEVCVLPSR